MRVSLKTLVDYLGCDPNILRTIIKKLGYRRNPKKQWRITDEMAIKIIKGYHLWKATKASKRKYLDLTAIRLAEEPTIHHKMATAFQKQIEINQPHIYSNTSKK